MSDITPEELREAASDYFLELRTQLNTYRQIMDRAIQGVDALMGRIHSEEFLNGSPIFDGNSVLNQVLDDLAKVPHPTIPAILAKQGGVAE